MKRLLAIGEALIDFIPEETGKELKHVKGFQPAVGGAPANVCGAFVKLGGEAAMITQLGDDPFGDKIMETFAACGIGCQYVKRTREANTSLAFVALKGDGNREFSFYRKPGADMLLKAEDVREEWFEDAFALHFCSVSLGDFPMNLRLQLWEDTGKLKEAVLEFMPLAHVLKISDEELEFITGHSDIEKALPELFKGNTRMVIYTKGSDGAECYTAHDKGTAAGKKVKAVDTTGAGDGFIGSFLHCLAEDGVTAESLGKVTGEKMAEYLEFANAFCGISVTKHGAIASYPTMEEMEAGRQ